MEESKNDDEVHGNKGLTQRSRKCGIHRRNQLTWYQDRANSVEREVGEAGGWCGIFVCFSFFFFFFAGVMK